MLSSLAKQEAAAKKRLEARHEERHRNIATLQRPGGINDADTPERIGKRLKRLAEFCQAQGAPSQGLERALRGVSLRLDARRQEGREAAAVATIVAPRTERRQLERVINAPDFIDVRYLENGVTASRSVGRVRIMTPAGRLDGYGTGFLIAPQLLLTNHHVLPSEDVAAASEIEFNFQDGADGQPLQPVVFKLAPDTFWMTDEQLDFALVAVQPGEGLDSFGWNRLIEAEGKVIIGEAVTIVQHPNGERKQIAIRENKVVDLPDLFIHYETDTNPGSSGSPVFNDQWEVVALHHAAVRVTGHSELGNYANEGIRVSRLMQYLRANRPSGSLPDLKDRLFEDAPPPGRRLPPVIRPIVPSREARASTSPNRAQTPSAGGGVQRAGAGGVVTLTIPIEISVRLGTGTPSGLRLVGDGASTGSASVVEEAVSIDPDYTNRKGYDSRFLGTGTHQVPLPKLTPAMRAQTATNSAPNGSDPDYVLPYHHYSVVMNKERRLAYFTAVNIDGHVSHAIKREPDKWFFDPRIPEQQQTGNDAYTNNPLDRGHLVRRLDPAWGTLLKIAKIANDDTFHYTNCSPQHHDFNANRTTWAGLEDYLLKNADNHDLKVSVFTGPVLAESDDEYRDIQLPRQFWKVAVMIRDDGELSATAYLLSQEELIQGLEREALEAFSYGAYKTYQVPIARIEDLTGLDFGALKDADPLDGQERLGYREIGAAEDLIV